MDKTAARSRPRRILHVDMDAFFAACELLRRPDLAGKPLVVGGSGDPQSRGVVSAASYEARRFGVRSGMALREAHRRCPQAVFLPVDFSYYASLSRRLYAILKRLTARVEPAGIDEAFADISAVAGTAEEIARRLKARVREELKLSASVGVATNKLMAKVASDLDKPDGLVVVKPGRERAVLAPLSVKVIPGIGPKTTQRLSERLGIETCGQLAAAPSEQLAAEFGERAAEWMHRVARGIDDSPLIEEWEPRSVSREQTFGADTDSGAVILGTLHRQLERLIRELHEEGNVAGTVTVKLRFARGFITRTRSQKLAQPTDRPEVIWPLVRELLGRFEQVGSVRLAGLRLSGLSRKEQGQLELLGRDHP
jgi:DNA polymerase-4